MKKVREAVPALNVVYRFLLALLLCMALAFLGGTVYSLFFRQETIVPASAPPDRTFTGMGRLRLPVGNGRTSSNQNSVAILSVTFPYTPEDRAFSEELAARVGEFRSVTAEYFLSFSADNIKKMSEEDIKKDLLDRYNSILRLGKIESLYFNEYLILE